MNCTEFNNTLTDVTGNDPDGFTAEQQAEFDAHRAACAACQASYEAEAAVLMALREMPVPAPSADFADRVLQAIKDQVFYVLPPGDNPWRDTANTRLEDIRLVRNPTFAPPAI